MKKFFIVSFILFLISCSNESDKSASNSEIILPKTISCKIVDDENFQTSVLFYEENKIISITSSIRKSVFTYEGNEIVKKVKYQVDGEKEIKFSETSYSYLKGKLDTVIESTIEKDTKYIYIPIMTMVPLKKNHIILINRQG